MGQDKIFIQDDSNIITTNTLDKIICDCLTNWKQESTWEMKFEDEILKSCNSQWTFNNKLLINTTNSSNVNRNQSIRTWSNSPRNYNLDDNK